MSTFKISPSLFSCKHVLRGGRLQLRVHVRVPSRQGERGQRHSLQGRVDIGGSSAVGSDMRNFFVIFQQK